MLLLTRCIAIAESEVLVYLDHDVLHAGIDGVVLEVAGDMESSVGVNVQVEWMETPTVRHDGVKQTEPLTLLGR